MKFNLTSRNIAIAVLLILTLILGIVSIIIATRLGNQNNNTIGVADCAPGQFDSHGCCPLKGESWCSANNLCQESSKSCGSTEPPPGSSTCNVQYGGGSVTIPNVDACNNTSLDCTKYTGPSNSGSCNENNNGTTHISRGQTVSQAAACGQCSQIDCQPGGGGTRVNGGACAPPPNNPPPPVSLICGDAKCKTGELCERTAAGGTTYKLCTTADVTAGTAPTGAASPTCEIATCTVPGVLPPPPPNPPPPPISTPLPDTAVISDDFDRLLAGFMLVTLGMLAYRFNLIGKVFENINALTEDDAIRNSALNRFLKNSRGNFEKKVEDDFKKDKK